MSGILLHMEGLCFQICLDNIKILFKGNQHLVSLRRSQEMHLVYKAFLLTDFMLTVFLGCGFVGVLLLLLFEFGLGICTQARITSKTNLGTMYGRDGVTVYKRR